MSCDRGVASWGVGLDLLTIGRGLESALADLSKDKQGKAYLLELVFQIFFRYEDK